MFSSDVELLLHQAFMSARDAGHAHVEVEHALLSALGMPTGIEYFKQHDIELGPLRDSLAVSLLQARRMDSAAEDSNPTTTTALQTAIQRAILTAQKEFRARALVGRLKMEVNVADLLTSLLQDRRPTRTLDID